VHLLALGKAAPAMAAAAVDWLGAQGRAPAGGIVIAPQGGAPAPLSLVTADHPVPAAASRRAADALGTAVAAIAPDDVVWVLLSGGASSLIAAPVEGVTDAELGALWRSLLESGLDIHAMNAVRRRFTRWGGGRLAAALAGHRIDVDAISDVPGDDVATIGSGPCAPDPTTITDVEQLLESAGLLSHISPRLRTLLRAPAPPLLTPGPGHPAFARVRTRIIASNDDAVRAAAFHAQSLGWSVGTPQRLTGAAASMGERLAGRVMDAPGEGGAPVCIVGGGETTVVLAGAASPAATPAADERLGGRCQELALAAARVLAERGIGGRAAILAAGTDGRDGPTDAAGAIVDESTWRRIADAGRDPAADLARHTSYAALDAAGALLRTGPTGTNVMDLAVGVRIPPA
jgi:hydroxypyruvate reductase